eukprot:5798285-Prymnesium_polylepis.1
MPPSTWCVVSGSAAALLRCSSVGLAKRPPGCRMAVCFRSCSPAGLQLASSIALTSAAASSSRRSASVMRISSTDGATGHSSKSAETPFSSGSASAAQPSRRAAAVCACGAMSK